MIEQFCIRTYDIDDGEVQNNNGEKSGCDVLNLYLSQGWTVKTVTSKPGYN